MLRLPRLLALAACFAVLASTSVPAQEPRPEEGAGRAEQPANKGRGVATFTAVPPADTARMGDRASDTGATARGGVWTQAGWDKVTAGWRSQDGAKFSACEKEAQERRLEGNAARSHIASCMNRS